MVNIFEYTDYRAYLKAYFEDRKLHDTRFSHRWLAQRLELSTSNFILLVMQGKRNLSGSLRLKLSEVFRHSPREADYFENMVNFAQARTAREEERHFSRMMALRGNAKVDTIEEARYEYYCNWYNPVIRELVTSPDFHGDVSKLAASLLPPITTARAKRSVELLVKLGFIRKEGERYVQTSKLVGTEPEVASVTVRNFHRAMGKLGVEALDRIPSRERSITSSTVYLSADAFETIRAKILELRKTLLALSDSEPSGERVYQVNFQAFPVTRNPKKKEKKS